MEGNKERMVLTPGGEAGGVWAWEGGHSDTDRRRVLQFCLCPCLTRLRDKHWQYEDGRNGHCLQVVPILREKREGTTLFSEKRMQGMQEGASQGRRLKLGG